MTWLSKPTRLANKQMPPVDGRDGEAFSLPVLDWCVPCMAALPRSRICANQQGPTIPNHGRERCRSQSHVHTGCDSPWLVECNLGDYGVACGIAGLPGSFRSPSEWRFCSYLCVTVHLLHFYLAINLYRGSVFNWVLPIICCWVHVYHTDINAFSSDVTPRSKYLASIVRSKKEKKGKGRNYGIMFGTDFNSPRIYSVGTANCIPFRGLYSGGWKKLPWWKATR